MIWVIVLLLAAILITLLGAWKVVPTILAWIVGIAVWIGLAAVAGSYAGTWAFGVVIGAPFAALFIFGMVQWEAATSMLGATPLIDMGLAGRS